MSATVHIDELSPETRAKVLAHISESAGMTALATVEKPSSLALGDPTKVDSETLGRFVRDGVIRVAQKLVELKPYVEELYRRLDRGEVILGCSTKKEFCQQVLQRTPRAVRYMLDGGNHNRGETVSPQVVMSAAGPQPDPAAPVGMPDSLRNIQLELCSRTDPRYENIREDHYIENHGAIGQQIHFLIHYKGGIVGIISAGSPVFATASRDEFFGITSGNRRDILQGIVNNNVFRLENHEPNLATRVLALWRHIVPHVFYEKYGTIVYGFETFVIETDSRKGTLYRADNWTFAGKTAGATKRRNGIDKPADNWKRVPQKLIFCRWRDGFTAPCSARTPGWIQKMCADISRSSANQPSQPGPISDCPAAAA